MTGINPELLIIAGPNGAGKTTFINTYLPEYTNVREFVNADLIAKGISPFDPEGASFEAGRIELIRIGQFLKEQSVLRSRINHQWQECERVDKESYCGGLYHQAFLYLSKFCGTFDSAYCRTGSERRTQYPCGCCVSAI
jgi:hypothetical protein